MLEFFLREIVPSLADLDRDVSGVVAAAFGDREEKLEQLLLQSRHDSAHHSEIDQRDPVIFRDENISWMRIGVKKTVDQNLLEIGAEKFLSQGGAIEFHPGEGAEVGDFLAIHVLHRQHARAAVIGDRFRDDDVRKLPQMFADGGEVTRFLAVIEFADKTLAKFIEHLAKTVALPGRSMVVKELRDFIERIEVLEHRVANSRALHFHRDLAAVTQTRLVDLA